jgi:cell division protein ZapA (FtsZ GTPase activity inhibitor)
MIEEVLAYDTAIVDELRQTIAGIFSIPAASVEPDASVWTHFPIGYRKDPPARERFYTWFVQHYKIYLTEEEWQNPTLIQLARMIDEKKSNPAPMLQNIRTRYRQMKTKLFLFIFTAAVLVILCLFILPLSITALLALFACGMAFWLWHLESKEFHEEIQPVVEQYKLKLDFPEGEKHDR